MDHIPTYLDDFQYLMGDAVSISDKTINKWIQDGFAYLNENPNNNSYSCSSGDTKVELERDENGNVTIEVLRHDGWTIVE